MSSTTWGQRQMYYLGQYTKHAFVHETKLLCKMAPEEMAAVLWAPNQLCFMWVFFALFVTYFVHNVSATVTYGKKELLDIRTAITHLGLDKDFFLQQR